MTDRNNRPRPLDDLLEVGRRSAAAVGPPATRKRPPVFGCIALGLPVLGLLVALLLVALLAKQGGDSLGRALMPAFVGSWTLFPAALLGIGASVVAFVRRERLIALPIVAVVLNGVILVPTGALTWMTLVTVAGR